MAESNRRGKKAVDEQLDDDDVLVGDSDDFADDTDTDSDDDELTQDDLDELEDIDVEPTTSSRRSRAGATKVSLNTKAVKGAKSAKITDEKPGIGPRIARFIREVVAELRKVNWPSRKELLTYASVVIVFVVIMMAIVGGLDYVFAWLVAHVFVGKQ